MLDRGRSGSAPRLCDEFIRVNQLVNGLTTSVALMNMCSEVVKDLEALYGNDPTETALIRELHGKLALVRRPQDYDALAAVYEAYVECVVHRHFKVRSIALRRTPGTGKHRQKRPDFVHDLPSGTIYVEVKALEIADPRNRHKEIGEEALEVAADLDLRSRVPGVHFGKEQVISGHAPGATAVERLSAMVEKIVGNVDVRQVTFGPTLLVVDLGRFAAMGQGKSGLMAVFFDSSISSCVSGELWQVGFGRRGERLFERPEFEGKTNLGGHLLTDGVLIQRPELLGIAFFIPGWSRPDGMLTLWNRCWDQGALQTPTSLDEQEVEVFLEQVSDGLNDDDNEMLYDHHKLG